MLKLSRPVHHIVRAPANYLHGCPVRADLLEWSIPWYFFCTAISNKCSTSSAMFFPPFRPAFSPAFRPAFSPAFRLLSRLPSFLSAFDLSFDARPLIK